MDGRLQDIGEQAPENSALASGDGTLQHRTNAWEAPLMTKGKSIAERSLFILDGGIGHLLKQRCVKTSVASNPEWHDSFLVSALANREAAEAVYQVHSDYIRAGCDMITCNNFSCTPWSLSRLGRTEDFKQLTKAAGDIAAKAVANAGQVEATPLVAGCLPPLTESYAVGTCSMQADAAATYSEIIRALAGSVDVLLCETMVSYEQALTAVTAGAAADLPLWVALTLEDSTVGALRGGEAAAAVAVQLAAQPRVGAILFNCSAPQAISAALPNVRVALDRAGRSEVRLGAYANGFYGTTSEWLASSSDTDSAAPVLHRNTDDYEPACEGQEQGSLRVMTPAAYTRFAVEWVAAGASIIGGCCGIGLAHMAAVRTALPRSY